MNLNFPWISNYHHTDLSGAYQPGAMFSNRSRHQSPQAPPSFSPADALLSAYAFPQNSSSPATPQTFLNRNHSSSQQSNFQLSPQFIPQNPHYRVSSSPSIAGTAASFSQPQSSAANSQLSPSSWNPLSLSSPTDSEASQDVDVVGDTDAADEDAENVGLALDSSLKHVWTKDQEKALAVGSSSRRRQTFIKAKGSFLMQEFKKVAYKFNDIEFKKGRLWTQIAEALNREFKTCVTGMQAENKFKHHKNQWKKCHDFNVNQTGGDRKTCPFYNFFEDLFYDNPIVNPVGLTSSSPKKEEAEAGDLSETAADADHQPEPAPVGDNDEEISATPRGSKSAAGVSKRKRSQGQEPVEKESGNSRNNRPKRVRQHKNQVQQAIEYLQAADAARAETSQRQFDQLIEVQKRNSETMATFMTGFMTCMTGLAEAIKPKKD